MQSEQNFLYPPLFLQLLSLGDTSLEFGHSKYAHEEYWRKLCNSS